MKTVRGFTLLAAGLLATAVFAPPSAKADEWNKKTVFTFNEAVEIPGQVLPPGTYVFKLADLLGDRHVVQIFDKNERHLFGTVLAIPDYRLKVRGKTIMTFEERAAGAPPAVKAWFYPGDNFGHEFVYPKVKAAELAQTNNTVVPSMTEENTTQATSQNLAQTPLMAEQPNHQETTIAEAYTPPPAEPPAVAPAPTPAPTPAPAESLPQTASPLPLIGLLGVLSLALGGVLRLAAARLG